MNAITPAEIFTKAAPEACVPTPIYQQTVYAITKEEDGRTWFADPDGKWNPDIVEACVMPRAEDFQWRAHKPQDGRVSAVTISIYDGSAMINDWRDYVAVMRATDKQGRIVAGADPMIVVYGPKEEPGKKRSQRMSGSTPWRAVTFADDFMSDEQFKRIDRNVPRLPHWDRPAGTTTSVMRRAISIAPVV